MRDSRRLVRTLAAIALAVIGIAPRRATAAGDATGSLGAGGTVTGDVSRPAGETDRIAIDLVAGATLVVTVRATFDATVVLRDPDGLPVQLDLAGTARRRGSVDVVRTGSYEFAVGSADGSQGLYKLSAKQSWLRAIDVVGTGPAVVDFGMPAGGKVACTLSPSSGATAEIAQLVDPNGLELLSTPVVVRGRTAKLRPTTIGAAGTCHLRIDAGDAGAWSARIIRRVPHLRPTTLRLSNGLDPVSYRNDGVGMVFSRHCASCHGWATSYAGVRQYAYDAYARMKKGIMPPGGGLSSAEIALVKTWISTGRQP